MQAKHKQSRKNTFILTDTQGDSDVILFHIYVDDLHCHLVGKTLKNICYFDIA